MPTYRIYYTEREVGDRRLDEPLGGVAHWRVAKHGEYVNETEWEEEIEASSADSALDAFLKEHVRDNTELMSVNDQGESQTVSGLSYDHEKTYIWIENDKLMEYQGLDEATPGMVSCPLCEGAGEVTVEVADEYLGDYGEEIGEREPEKERPTWG